MLTWAVPGPDCLLCTPQHLSWDSHWVSPSPATSQLPGAVQAQVLVRCHTALYMCHYTPYALNARTHEYSRTTNKQIWLLWLMVDSIGSMETRKEGPAEECCLGHLLKLQQNAVLWTHVHDSTVYSTVYSVQYSAQVSGATLSTLCPTLTVLELHPPHSRDRDRMAAPCPHP